MGSKKDSSYRIITALNLVTVMITTLSITDVIDNVTAAILLILNCVVIGIHIMLMTRQEESGETKRETESD